VVSYLKDLEAAGPPRRVVFRAITDISNLPWTNPDSNFTILPSV